MTETWETNWKKKRENLWQDTPKKGKMDFYLVIKMFFSSCCPRKESGGFGYTPSYKVEIEEIHQLIKELKLNHGWFLVYFRMSAGQFEVWGVVFKIGVL